MNAMVLPAVTGWPVARRWNRRGPARLVLAGTALLAGCAGPPTATAPPAPAPAQASTPAPAAADPTARLLLRGAVAAQDGFAAYHLIDALNCKDPQLLVAGRPDRMPDPAPLPADRLTTLDFVILRDGQPSCSTRWSFTPRADKTYLLQGLALGGGCSARIVDVSQPDQPRAVADAVLRSLPGQACLPLAEARARAAPAGASIQGGQHRGEAVLNPRATTQGLEGLIRP